MVLENILNIQFQHQTEPVRKAIYETKIRQRDGTDARFNMSDGVAMIRQGLFGFHVELGVAFKLVADTFQEHEKCNLQVMDFYNFNDLWYAIKRNSTLRRVVTVGMFRLREHGIQARENSLLYTKKPTCHGRGGSFLSIGLADVTPAFQFLLWGFLISFILLVLEILANICIQKYFNRVTLIA